jgi:hypothetical protein
VDAPSSAFQTAPLLWDRAKARGYRTAYLTSQNLGFRDLGRYLAGSRIDRMREARDRVPYADLDLGTPDEQSAQETLDFLLEGSRPAFAVWHLSNTHLPYRQAPGHTPHSLSVDHADARSLVADIHRVEHARYLNSLVLQDAVVGDFVRRLRATGRRAIIVYTADHGEAFGEHAADTHTFDLYREAIDVPLWIDVPDGALAPVQLSSLRAAAETRPVFTADVTATLVDLLGGLLGGLLGASDSGDAMPATTGWSALAPAPPTRDMKVANCTAFRGCFPESWGIVRWPRAFLYIGRSMSSFCFDLEKDPDERAPLAFDACADLRQRVVEWRGIRPDFSLAR